MVRKIIISLMLIGMTASLIGMGTFAYFSDTETSTGNVASAGILDISVTGEDGGPLPIEIEDLKPCEIRYGKEVVTNEGTNPVVVWKHTGITGTDGGDPVYPSANPVASSEPEYEEGLTGAGGAYEEKHDIDTVIDYDLKITHSDGTEEILIPEENPVVISDVHCKWIRLGEIQPGESITVVQSYHMQADVTNWAQGDRMLFDMQFYAQQLADPNPPGEVYTIP